MRWLYMKLSTFEQITAIKLPKIEQKLITGSLTRVQLDFLWARWRFAYTMYQSKIPS